MKRASIAAALCALSLASVAGAREVEGVQVPETLQVEGKQLSLVGAGTRTKFFVKVYVASLYMEGPRKDAGSVLAADEVKRVQMVMLRDMDKRQIAGAIREAFSRNAKAQLPVLQERLDQLIAQVPDARKGETIVITYVPAKGTLLSGIGGEKAVIPGKDFADAMFSVWLGKNPVDDNLKKAMLGG
jgi:hypothetical protein